MLPSHPHPLPAFGHRLRRLRRALGVKQAALAEMAGVDQATVSRWESGAIRPGDETQRAILRQLGAQRAEDAALKRLVEGAAGAVHLVDEASHACLAVSPGRAAEWRVGQRSLLGVSLWQYATDEIRMAEAHLAATGWWETHVPAPHHFRTSAAQHDGFRILAGSITWERLYLSDGTPARLVTGARHADGAGRA